MEVFQSCGKEGWLKVCVDDGEVVCFNFKINVHVSVSYTGENDGRAHDTDPSPVMKIESGITPSGKEEEEEDKRKDSNPEDPLDEELNGFIERAKHAQEQNDPNIFSKPGQDLHSNEEDNSGFHRDSENQEDSMPGVSIAVDLDEPKTPQNFKQEEKKEDFGNDNKEENSCEDNEPDFDDGHDDMGDNYHDGDDDVDTEVEGSQEDELSRDDEKEEKDDNSMTETENEGPEETSSNKEMNQTDCEERKKNDLKSSSPQSVGESGGTNSGPSRTLDLENDDNVSDKVKDTVEASVSSSSKFPLKKKKKEEKNDKTRIIYKCNICCGEFNDGYLLTNHQRAQNTKETCSVCNLECMSKAYLIMHQHLKHSTATTRKGKSCPVCSKLFSNQSDILLHIRSQHTNEGLYRCCVCHILFQDFQSFNQHLDYFTKHKKCQKETKDSSTDGVKSSSPIKTKPVSVVLTKLSAQKIDSLSKGKSLSSSHLTSLMNFQAPKPQQNKSPSGSKVMGKPQNMLPSGSKGGVRPQQNASSSGGKHTLKPLHAVLPGGSKAVGSKRRVAQLPQKRPVNPMPVNKPTGQTAPMKRPLDQMLVRRPVDPRLIGKSGEHLLMRKPLMQSPMKRPLDQSQLRRSLGQSPLKKPRPQTPLEQVLAKRGLGQPLAKKLAQLPLRRPGDLMPLKKPVRPLPTPSSSGGGGGPSSSKSSLDLQLMRSKFGLLPGSSSSNLKRNKRNYAWNKLWKCHFCERVFRTKGDYIGHKKPSRISKVCKECGFTSPSEALYLIHQYQKHTNYTNDRYTVVNKDLRCHICEEPVALNEVLNHVMSKHTGEHPYECCVCKAPAQAYEEWVSHGKRHLRSTEEKTSLKENKLMACLSVKMGVPEKSNQVFCNLCKTYFETEEEFVRHHKPESKNKECEICRVICHSEAGFMIHKYISHGLSPGDKNETAVAELPTSVSGNFTMWHEDEVGNETSTESRKCPSCLETFPMKDLLNHVMNTHTLESPYQCCACKTTVANLEEYVDHCDFHLGKKLYARGTQRCLVCGLRFDTRSRLSRHKLMHKPSCTFCHVEFSSKILLEVHLKNHHTSDMTPCSYCKKLFADKNRLAEHERNHFFYKQTPCPTCGLQVSHLNKHIARWHSNKEPEFLCNLCGQKYPSKSALSRHMVTHTSDRRHECDICKKTFKRSSGLQRHAQSHLKNRKFYECHICGKKCSQRNNLSVHMRIHASVKAFTCEHCGQGFNYNQSLQTHIRKKHMAGESTSSTTTGTTSSSTTASASTSATSRPPNAASSSSSSSTRTPASSTATVTVPKPEPSSAPPMDPIQPMDIMPPRVIVTPACYPEHHPPIYPDPSQQFYPPDPSVYLPAVNSFQQSYSNLINTIVRSDQDSSQPNQQQGYPVFYQQF